MEYATREINHGSAFGFYATITKNEATGVVSFGTPKEWTGLIKASFETTQESTAYYADNVQHVTIKGAKTTTGTITTYQISQDFFTNHLGKKVTNSTPPALLDTGVNLAFLFGYAETVSDEYGVDRNEWVIFTNVKASVPKGDSQTDEDKVTPKEIEIPLTASPNNIVKDKDGMAVTEIIFRDNANNDATTLIQSMFDETDPATVEEVLATIIGE